MKRNTKLGPKFIASVGILSGLSIVLMMVLEFPLPFMPPFLKLDFSNIPALVGGFAYGPVTGVAIVLIKVLVHLLRTSTGGVGELADFIASGAMVFVSALMYKKFKTKKGAIAALAAGTCAMALAGAVANYFILIPFYANLMPIDVIFEKCGAVNPLINNLFTYILYGAIPFNLIKGIILSLITFLIYKHISRVLH